MVSNGKRMRYVSENCSTSEEDSYDEMDYKKENDCKVDERKRKPKCLSKNALMARENRLKKKLYVNKLEKEILGLKNVNKKLTSVVTNQSSLLTDLKKEVQYLKSVIANSSDIKNLIRNIHSSTGMSVSSSMDKNLSLNNVSIPKKNLNGSENNKEEFSDIPTTDFLLGSDVDLGVNDWCDDIDAFPLAVPDSFLTPTYSPNMEEHNYTISEDNEDVGVCLHVSKHRVSLEFCNKCSEKAQESWSCHQL